MSKETLLSIDDLDLTAASDTPFDLEILSYFSQTVLMQLQERLKPT